MGHNLRQCYFGHAGSMATKASVFDNVGLFSGMPIVGDIEVIHRLMEYHPETKIRCAPQATVIHEEVTNLWHCLRKYFEFGQYLSRYTRLSTYRPL